MKIYSFTFARSGSKGLKDKNLSKFNKKPLLYWAINDAKKSKYINKVFVSTDSAKLASISRSAGAEIPFIRPKRFATDKSPEYLAWQHALNFLKKQNDLPDIFVSVPCTSPLRTYQDLDNMISMFIKKKPNFLVGMCESNRNPYFNIVKKMKGSQIKIFSSKKKFFRRQDAPETFDLTTFAFIAKPNYILKFKNYYHSKAMGFKIDKKRSVDVDNLDDLEYAEFIRKKYDIKK